MSELSPVALLAYGLMFVGLIGSALPLLPGPVLIWFGALLWAWGNGFQALGWPTLLVLGLLTVVAWSSDLFLTTYVSRRVGASWKSIAGAICGGLIGGILFGGWIPVLGTLLATVAGSIVGILVVEYLDKREIQPAVRASQGYIFGYLAASALEAFLAVLMIALFAWQAFL